MKNLNPSSPNCRRHGVIGLGLRADHGPAVINVKVFHGLNQYEVAVPSNSSFGYLKSVISQKIGLKPEMHKLFFGGEEKRDDEGLQTAGLKHNSEVLLKEDTPCEQISPEEVQETCVISKGDEAVAEVRKQVEKLVQQVLALQAVLDSGTKVDDKEIIYLSEMLMRQLLKLDGIEAEGEGKVQRKIEVRRVQSILETLDILKSRNSNDFSNKQKTASATTQQEAVNPGSESVRSVTSPWETFDPACGTVNAVSPLPYLVPSAPPPMPYFTHSYVPFTSAAAPYYAPSPVTYYIPPAVLPSTPSAMPHFVPSPFPSSAPFPMPSSPSKVTQNWEHFG